MVYPAKLIKNGRVVKDELPDWQKYIRTSRLKSFESISFDPNVLNPEMHTPQISSSDAPNSEQRNVQQCNVQQRNVQQSQNDLPAPSVPSGEQHVVQRSQDDSQSHATTVPVHTPAPEPINPTQHAFIPPAPVPTHIPVTFSPPFNTQFNPLQIQQQLSQFSAINGVSPMVNPFHPMMMCQNPAFAQLGQGVQTCIQPMPVTDSGTGQTLDQSYTATHLAENPVVNMSATQDLTTSPETCDSTEPKRVDSTTRTCTPGDSENTDPKRVESPRRSRSRSSVTKSREKRSESVHPYYRRSQSRTRSESESRQPVLPNSINRPESLSGR